MYRALTSNKLRSLEPVQVRISDYQPGVFQIPAGRAHLSLSLILCACSNIHLSDYRRVQLSADILRPPYPADNQTFSVIDK